MKFLPEHRLISYPLSAFELDVTYVAHFTDKKTEDQRSSMACTGS